MPSRINAVSHRFGGVVAQANARGSLPRTWRARHRGGVRSGEFASTPSAAYLHAFSKDANGEMRRPDVAGIRPPRPPGEPGSTTTGASTHDCDSNLTSRGRGPANGARRRGRHRVSGYRDPIHVLVHQDAVRGVHVPVSGNARRTRRAAAATHCETRAAQRRLGVERRIGRNERPTHGKTRGAHRPDPPRGVTTTPTARRYGGSVPVGGEILR